MTQNEMEAWDVIARLWKAQEKMAITKEFYNLKKEDRNI